MKHLIIFITVLHSLCLYANNPDSLKITVHKSDSIQYCIYINVENISNDTILLVTKFDHELIEQPVVSGFRFGFYNGNLSFFPSLGDNYTIEYIYFGGRKFIYPNESIRLPIDLNDFFKTKEDIVEHSIEIEMAYKYFVISSDPQKRKVRRCYIVTDRLRIN